MFAAWFIPPTGKFCPVIVVGEEGGKVIVWKLLNGIVLERVVEYSDLFTLDYWIPNMETHG